MVIDERLQLLNASVPISLTEPGIVIEDSLVHSLNMLLRMTEMEFGNRTEFSQKHSQNASSPISLTESGIVIDVKVLHPLNASAQMASLCWGWVVS